MDKLRSALGRIASNLNNQYPQMRAGNVIDNYADGAGFVKMVIPGIGTLEWVPCQDPGQFVCDFQQDAIQRTAAGVSTLASRNTPDTPVCYMRRANQLPFMLREDALVPQPILLPGWPRFGHDVSWLRNNDGLLPGIADPSNVELTPATIVKIFDDITTDFPDYLTDIPNQDSFMWVHSPAFRIGVNGIVYSFEALDGSNITQNHWRGFSLTPISATGTAYRKTELARLDGKDYPWAIVVADNALYVATHAAPPAFPHTPPAGDASANAWPPYWWTAFGPHYLYCLSTTSNTIKWKRLISPAFGSLDDTGGTDNEYVIDGGLSAYTDGMVITVNTTRENTDVSTLDAGAGAQPISHEGGSALSAGDITVSGFSVVWTGTGWQLLENAAAPVLGTFTVSNSTYWAVENCAIPIVPSVNILNSSGSPFTFTGASTPTGYMVLRSDIGFSGLIVTVSFPTDDGYDHRNSSTSVGIPWYVAVPREAGWEVIDSGIAHAGDSPVTVTVPGQKYQYWNTGSSGKTTESPTDTWTSALAIGGNVCTFEIRGTVGPQAQMLLPLGGPHTASDGSVWQPFAVNPWGGSLSPAGWMAIGMDPADGTSRGTVIPYPAFLASSSHRLTPQPFHQDYLAQFAGLSDSRKPSICWNTELVYQNDDSRHMIRGGWLNTRDTQGVVADVRSDTGMGRSSTAFFRRLETLQDPISGKIIAAMDGDPILSSADPGASINNIVQNGGWRVQGWDNNDTDAATGRNKDMTFFYPVGIVNGLLATRFQRIKWKTVSGIAGDIDYTPVRDALTSIYTALGSGDPAAFANGNMDTNVFPMKLRQSLGTFDRIATSLADAKSQIDAILDPLSAAFAACLPVTDTAIVKQARTQGYRLYDASTGQLNTEKLYYSADPSSVATSTTEYVGTKTFVTAPANAGQFRGASYRVVVQDSGWTSGTATLSSLSLGAHEYFGWVPSGATSQILLTAEAKSSPAFEGLLNVSLTTSGSSFSGTAVAGREIRYVRVSVIYTAIENTYSDCSGALRSHNAFASDGTRLFFLGDVDYMALSATTLEQHYWLDIPLLTIDSDQVVKRSNVVCVGNKFVFAVEGFDIDEEPVRIICSIDAETGTAYSREWDAADVLPHNGVENSLSKQDMEIVNGRIHWQDSGGNIWIQP